MLNYKKINFDVREKTVFKAIYENLVTKIIFLF